MQKGKKASILLFFLILPLSAGPVENMFKAFEERPEYVRPFATILGSMTNAGWYQSASVGKDFSFGVALPISLMYLNNRDREYSGTYIDEGCRKCREREAECNGCVECQKFTAPTVFGTIRTPEITRSIIDLNFNVVTDTLPVDPPFSDGIEELTQIAGLPFLSLQTTFSIHYTAVTLRYMGIPAIPGTSLNFPGIGLQHDFQYLLPSLPVSLSVAANFTFLIISLAPEEWTDDGTMSGNLSLNGLSNFLGILAGYKPVRFLEVFLETGWEHSFLKPSGTLIVNNETIKPSLTLKGRNGFRTALNIAFPIKYNPVIGGIGGAQFGYLVNLIGFKSRKKE
ncbi:MAG: hypothetical protein JXA18_02395 [Chitinispirillaceae bacterium]|nr:hypothetical protein [Chitinispirillaceae bacterium]